MEKQGYDNPFEDVHKKAKALKEHTRETQAKDAELRERPAVRDAEGFFDKIKKPD